MKKNALFIAKNLHWGGAELSLLHLIKWLKNLGVHSSLIAGSEGEQRTAFEEVCEQVIVVPLPYRRKPLTWFKIQKFLSTVEALTTAVGAPSVVLANDFYETWACHLATKHTRCAHAGAIWQSSYNFTADRDVLKWFQQGANRMQILMASGAVASHMNAQLGDLSRVHTINPYIDDARFDPALYDRDQLRRQLGWEDRHVGIVVGALSKNDGKGQLALTKAFLNTLDSEQTFPERLLCLVGPFDADSSAEIRRLVSGKESLVQILGPRPDVPEIFAASDIALFPGRIPESFGLAILEARLMEKPILALENHGAVRLHEGTPGFDLCVSVDQIISIWQNAVESSARIKKLGGREIVVTQYGQEAFKERLSGTFSFLFR